jgi:hypothetical protein
MALISRSPLHNTIGDEAVLHTINIDSEINRIGRISPLLGMTINIEMSIINPNADNNSIISVA